MVSGANDQMECTSINRDIADVYRIQLLAPAMMAKDIKTRALQLVPLLEDIDIKHPLVRVDNHHQNTY